MTNTSAALLTAFGLLTLLIGFFCGAPLGSAINREAPEPRIRAWRVAHSSLVGGGVMLLAIASNLARIELPAALKAIASILLCLSVGFFGFALILGAHKGHRGTKAEPGAWPRVIYLANLSGVGLSMIAVLLFSWGGVAHLLRVLLLAP